MKPRLKGIIAISLFLAVMALGVWLLPNAFESGFAAVEAASAPKTPEPDPFEYEDAKNFGFQAMTKAEHADYYFTTNIRNRADAVYRCEKLLALMKNEFGYEFERPSVCILDGESLPGKSARLLNRVSMDISDPLLSASFLQSVLDEDIPSWYFAALESYYFGDKAEIMSYDAADMWYYEHKDEIPPFGDAWLFPNFFEGSETARDALISLVVKQLESGAQSYLDILEAIGVDGGAITYRIDDANSLIATSVEAVYTYEYGDTTLNWNTFAKQTEYMDAALAFCKEYVNFRERDRMKICVRPAFANYVSMDAGGYDLIFKAEDGVIDYKASQYIATYLCAEAISERPDNILGFFYYSYPNYIAEKFSVKMKDKNYVSYAGYLESIMAEPEERLDARDLKIKTYYISLCERKGLNYAEFDYSIFSAAVCMAEYIADSGYFEAKLQTDGRLLYTFVERNNLNAAWYASYDFTRYLFENYDRLNLINLAIGNTSFIAATGSKAEIVVDMWLADRGVETGE